MVTIRVIGSSGYGVSGADVYISWGAGLFDTYSKGRTDSSGYVSFTVSPGNGTISVDGRQVYSGYISGTVTAHAS